MVGYLNRNRTTVLIVAAVVVAAYLSYFIDGPRTRSVLVFAWAYAVPLVLASMVGIIGERSGVVNIGIEGQMLAAAFAAFFAAAVSRSLLVGVLAGIGTGILMGAFLAVTTVRWRMDQIIAGVVLNIVATGLTSFYYSQGQTLPRAMPKFSVPLLSEIPLIGPAFFHNGAFALFAIVAVLVLQYLLFSSRWGLRTRAIGEHPHAADTAGVNVVALRLFNVSAAGLLAGAAGAYLSFLALAIMIFGAWHPLRAMAAALFFGFTAALASQLQADRVVDIPPQFVNLLPYVLTLVVLAVAAERVHPPAAVGQPFGGTRGGRGAGAPAGRGRPTVRQGGHLMSARHLMSAPAGPGSTAASPDHPAGRLLELDGVTRAFGAVKANTGITMHVDRGEIVALLGENGAGKSTLVKQIFGLLKPDTGTIKIKGDPRPVKNPSDAIRRGVGMVHQHFQLVPVMTVAENLILGNEPTRAGRVDLDSARTMVRELSTKYGLRVDADARVEDMPVGAQQRAEILKALSRDAELLILDEPTAVLTPQETDELLSVMRDLADRGTSIVFITHKLREVLAVADRVYVLRGGRVAGEVAAKDTDQAALARMMVGRSVVLAVDKEPSDPGDVVLQVSDLVVRDERKLPAVDGFSVNVRAGEIVGLAGVEGNGQRELVEAIAGMRKPESGSVTMLGKDITAAHPFAVHDAGVGHIPEDREKHGLVSGHTIADNLILNRFTYPQFSRRGVRDESAINDNATALREQFDIRSSGIHAHAGSLSGGNKQKIVVARELSAKPRLLVAAQPTRGVDVGSIEFIHQQIVAARDDGAAVLLVSAELDEVLSLSDRIVVIHAGRAVAQLPAEGADRAEIGRLMAGGGH